MDTEKTNRQEYDKQYYLRKKLQKQIDAKTFFVKNPSQTYTMVRRNNIERKLKDNDAKMEAFKLFLKSKETV
jgi:hypothetical protein